MRKTLIIAVALILLCGLKASGQEPLLRFGVFADAQYDRDTTDNKLHRHYARSREWLAEAIDTFNTEDLAFTVSLGDLIDRTIDSFGDIKPILNASRAPILYIFGNHDYPKPYNRAVQRRVFKAIGQDDRYRSLEYGPVRLVLLNTNEIAPYSSAPDSKTHAQAMSILHAAKDAGLHRAKNYNGSVSDKQLRWLEKELKTARKKGQKVLVMGHAPLAPEDGKSVAMNASAICRVLSAYEDTVLAYLCGHEHKGGLHSLGAIPLITFRGMCEGARNRYAVVTVLENGLDVRGYGDQESFRFSR